MYGGPYLGGEDRAHIQFITPSSMVGAGPRWADQMNSSNEAAKATPQTTTTFSASTLTWTPGETVLAIAGICDLPFQPHESKLVWHWYLIQCAESVKDVTFASTNPAGGPWHHPDEG